jgi:hypothetical protein
MPEGGLPRATRSHTSTAEWKGFEIRMRRRRVERCVLRAKVALEAGFADDARQALAEARQLDPYEPSLDELATRIGAAFDTPPARPRAATRRWLPTAAAVLLLGVLSALLTLVPGPTPHEVPAATAHPAGEDAAPPRAPAVGIREQFVTPEIVVSEPSAPSATARPDTATSSEPARQAAGPEPTSAPPAAAAATPPVPPVAAAPAVAATPDPPARASAQPAPTDPVPVGTGGVTPAAREAAEPAVDPVRRERIADPMRCCRSMKRPTAASMRRPRAPCGRPSTSERSRARSTTSSRSASRSSSATWRWTARRRAPSAAAARAGCRKSAAAGGRQARRWTFDLRQAGGGWQIVRAEAR